MAAMVGSSGSGVFSAAISQSPVSDWHYYGRTRSCDCHVTITWLYLHRLNLHGEIHAGTTRQW